MSKPRSNRAPLHRTSQYLTMPDGVRLALDVYLPTPATGPVATILHQTRYFRSVAMRRPFSWIPLARAMDTDFETRQRFVAAGYAWVSLCVRGSGASTGTSPYPWSALEVGDGARVLDWIVAQPWSNGRVGSTGISYSGTSAEMLASTGHPALRAIAPRFSCFDVYADVAFPGGLHLESFTRSWGELNRRLDGGDIGGAVALNLALSGAGCADLGSDYRWLKAAAGPRAQALIRSSIGMVAHGVGSVDEDRRRRSVESALREHDGNGDIHEGALRIVHRDDRGFSTARPDDSIDDFSPHRRVSAVRDSGVAMLSYSGWLDGAYAGAAAKRHAALGGTGQLVIGPWNHGGQQDISPFTKMGAAVDDHTATLLQFFDRHVRGLSTDASTPRVCYFTLGEERWKEAETWPPADVRRRDLFLGPEGRLTNAPSEASGTTVYAVDVDTRTGRRARWDSLLGIKAPIGYLAPAELCRRATCFTAPPLEAPLEITGHPRVHLTLASTHPDGSVFAYLVDVAPSGDATIITEGMLRLLHRRVDDGEPHLVTPRTYEQRHAEPVPRGVPVSVVIDLLPISYRVPHGHALRLALTGADADHFRPVTVDAPTFEWFWGGRFAARVELPVIASHPDGTSPSSKAP